MSKIYDYLMNNKASMLHTLERLVKAESPSTEKELVDQCGQTLQTLFYQHLGLHAEIIPQEQVGHHLKFTYGSSDKQILIIGHFDTVWEKGRLNYRVEGNRAFGPGIFDMKGGIIQALWAIKALKELQIELDHKIVFLCTSDEEIGSFTSRSVIEEEARKSKVVFVPEPPVAKSGALKTSRKGVGIFNIKVKGVASHAGNHHDQGINAIEELSHHILKLQGLTDYEKGTTVNVGMIKGGNRINVVADEAEAGIDVRVATQDEGRRIEQIIRNIKPVLEGTSIEVTGDWNRPPLERTPAVEKLFQTAQGVAKELGFELFEAAVGGGSDGSFTAALGIPTLDGLGAVGDGPHAEYEHILIDKLPQRSALIAHLLMEV